MTPDIISKAVGFLGAAEPTGDNQFIEYYNKLTGAAFSMSVQWCAIFVTTIARMDQVSTGIIPTFADCDVGKLWFKNKGRYEKSRAYGGNYLPREGDVIFYSTKRTQEDATHVGYVVSVNNGILKAIEGNHNDKVAYRDISLTDDYIIGYGRSGEYLAGNSGNGATSTKGFQCSVSDFQQWLNNNYGNILSKYMGAVLQVDNIYGPKTRNAALCAWKYELNKRINGYKFELDDSNYGPMCLRYGSYGIVKNGSVGPFTYIVQGLLRVKGYYYGDLDGIAGTLTQVAIKSYQNAKKGTLDVDGICGSKTYEKLFNS